ncbi:hypothetical protein quinque_008691 [Culex quinquefasciatus]
MVDEVQPQPSSRMTSGKISDCGNHGHIGLEPVVMQEVHYIGTHYQIFHQPDTYAKKIAAEYPGFLFKRAPSGFFGMRGKKQNNEGIKRAPYGFTVTDEMAKPIEFN